MNTQVKSLESLKRKGVGVWGNGRQNSGHPRPFLSRASTNVTITPNEAATLPSRSGFFLCRPPFVPMYPLLIKLLPGRLPGLIPLNSDPSFHSVVGKYLLSSHFGPQRWEFKMDKIDRYLSCGTYHDLWTDHNLIKKKIRQQDNFRE